MGLNDGYSYLTHDNSDASFEYIIGGERPSVKLWWVDDQGDLINLSSGFTFTVTVEKGGTAYVTKTSGITGAAGSGLPDDGTPNLTISWSDGEFASIPNAGLYLLKINASATSDGADLFLTFNFRYTNPGSVTWTYSGDPSTSSLESVRYLVGDTDYTDQLASDQEIEWQLSMQPNVQKAAAETCLAIAARFARYMDRSIGSLSTSFSQKHQHYLDLATRLSKKGSGVPVSPWARGWSRSDKEAVNDDTDREKTFSRKGVHDNDRRDYGDHEYGSRFGWDD